MLEELNTRPAITYLTKVLHPGGGLTDGRRRHPHRRPPDGQSRPRRHADVTRDVVATLGRPATGLRAAAARARSRCSWSGSSTFQILVKDGLGHAGYKPPILWSVYITTFVFWIGIGHAGTLISAILFLFRAPVAHGDLPLRRGDDGVRGHDGRRCSRSSTSGGSGSSTGCCRIPN